MAGEVPATARFPHCQSGDAPRAIPGYPAAAPAAHNRTARIFTPMMVLGAFTTAAGIVGGRDNGLLDGFRSLPMARSAALAGVPAPARWSSSPCRAAGSPTRRQRHHDPSYPLAALRTRHGKLLIAAPSHHRSARGCNKYHPCIRR